MAQELKTYDFPVDHGDFTTTIELFYLKSEVDAALATTLEREVPRIADKLERIAVALESCSKNHAPPDIIQSAMGPGDDDDIPF